MLLPTSLPLSLLTGFIAISGLVNGGNGRTIHKRQTSTSDNTTGTTALVLVTESTPSPSTTSVAYTSAAYQLQGPLIDIKDTQIQTFTLQAYGGFTWNIVDNADVTSWFVDCRDKPIFGQNSSVAEAATVAGNALTIQLHVSNIDGFTTNGPGTLTVRPPSGALTSTRQASYKPHRTTVGTYSVPKLRISSDIRGSAYTHAHSTLKELLGVVVTYDADTDARLSLELPGLDDSKIAFDNATLTLVDGDGYYTSEYILKSNKLTGSWLNGRTSYTLQQGDIVINTGGYLLKDINSGREWSCLGGDGQGNYIFNLEVAGITYNGLPVAAQTFPVHIYIYGYNYTSDAITKYGTATIVEPVIEPLSKKTANPPKPGSTPIYTWVGDGDLPNLADAQADDVYITWPVGTDASDLEACDVRIVLLSVHGDTLTLEAGRDFVTNTSSSETQIAITLQNWPFEPVYNTMSIDVDAARLKGAKPSAASLTKTYDVASVYVYLAQQGGGGTTIDGTVTAYSFYGLANLTQVDQVTLPANYTLGTTVNGAQKYYAENANGTGILVDTIATADVYDGSGVDDRNLQLIGNTVYITTRVNATATKTIEGLPVAFTKAYLGGATLSPNAADPYLTSQPGYFLNKTDTTWVYHEKWAWQSSIAVAWGGIDIQPYTGKFEWTLAKGTSQQFTAGVPSVTWSLIGNTSLGTTISNGGNLTIATDETADSIAVVATSTTDKSYQGKGTVNVAVSG